MILKVLLKKQLTEIFRSYFYDAKNNKARSKGTVFLLFLLFAALMFGLIGGMFTGGALYIGPALIEADMGWFYYMIFCLTAIVFGVFGSVFNTYSVLYLSKDNDLLFSMPIPVKYIIVSRLLSVYLMGLLYSGVGMIPTFIVYLALAGFSLQALIGGIVMTILVSVIVLLLSCLLGWVVAKASSRMKNRTFAVVALSVVFILLYYFFFFKASDIMSQFLVNIITYGDAVKTNVYGLFLFGRAAEGDPIPLLGCVLIVVLLAIILWLLLKRSFFSIAASQGSASKVKYHAKQLKQSGVFSALLSKEGLRFRSSSAYILNCGFGLFMVAAAGVVLLVKGPDMFEKIAEHSVVISKAVPSIVLAMICILAAMVDIAAPSVSLEGRTLWLLKSLPVSPWQILSAKTGLQVILTAVPALFTAICAVVVMRLTLIDAILFVAAVVVFLLFIALWGLFVGLKLPNLNWTNEVAVIKQGACIFFAMFGGMLFGILVAVPYFIVGTVAGLTVYLLVVIAVLALLTFLFVRWMKTKGSAILMSL